MRSNRDFETINKRCELLESLGFTIEHHDTRVSLGELSFDFSAIELTPENIIKFVASEALIYGVTKGRNEIKVELKQLLEISY